jgi:hypothetical protein
VILPIIHHPPPPPGLAEYFRFSCFLSLPLQ